MNFKELATNEQVNIQVKKEKQGIPPLAGQTNIHSIIFISGHRTKRCPGYILLTL